MTKVGNGCNGFDESAWKRGEVHATRGGASERVERMRKEMHLTVDNNTTMSWEPTILREE